MLKLRISYKIIIGVGFITSVAIIVFSYLILRSQCQGMVSQLRLSGYQLSETIKSSTRHDMLTADQENVHRTIDQIGMQKGINKVRIFNKIGMIMYSSDKDEINTMVDKNAEACYVCHAADQPLEKLSIPERTRIFKGNDGHRSLGIINPIYNEPSCWQGDCHAHPKDQKVLGVLDITLSLEDTDRLIALNRKRMVIFGIVVLTLVSVILWRLVQKLVGEPVKMLVEATKVIASGNLNHKIKINSRDELGDLAQAFNVMTEKLVEAQHQVYQQDKLASLGRLAAGVAHEINNPLTGILTYSSFLLKRSEHYPEIKDDLDVIVRETKRCRDIVKGLLDFARQVPSKKSHLNINDVICHSLDLLENQLLLHHIHVEKELSPTVPDIIADANQMEQVFINLIVNAADAIGEQKNGVLRIKSEAQMINFRNYVKIDLSDNGCGMSEDQLSKIFEPFYTTKGQKGTGLGLAVVWGIMEKHGGKIKVESQPGQGTTFTLLFPVDGEQSSL
ncbi:MAG: sensor histidine kinase [Gemmatimonadetes bacterium]|nr:MAG: sensor histidine kinase [Gemmatimonadota bacterium]